MSVSKDPKAVTIFDFSSQDAVTLVVGAEQEEMLVHGTYLSRNSEFFKAALKKEWVEGQTRLIKLPEESPDVMKHYLTYVYHDKLKVSDTTPTELMHYYDQYSTLADLYMYGERFLNRALQHAVIENIIRLTATTRADTKDLGKTYYCFPAGPLINKLYNGTPAGSPGRRLLVDLYVRNGLKQSMTLELEPQFILDAASALYDSIEAQDEGVNVRSKVLNAEDYL